MASKSAEGILSGALLTYTGEKAHLKRCLMTGNAKTDRFAVFGPIFSRAAEKRPAVPGESFYTVMGTF